MRWWEPISLVISLVLAAIWVSQPGLSEYSLQLATILFLIYFLVKRWQGSRWNKDLHHIMPKADTIEASVLLAAVAVVVGSSGGLASPFLPLFYLLLFVSVLTLHLYTNLVEMVALIVFLWTITPPPFTTNHFLELISLPLLLPLMLFARWQFEEAQEDKFRLQLEEQLLAKQESKIMIFLSTYLQPLLRQMKGMLYINPDNRFSVIKQLEQLEQEIQQLMHELDQADDTTEEIAQQAKTEQANRHA